MKPRAAANEIIKILEAVPGYNPYPLDLPGVISQIINVKNEGEEISIIDGRLFR